MWLCYDTPQNKLLNGLYDCHVVAFNKDNASNEATTLVIHIANNQLHSNDKSLVVFNVDIAINDNESTYYMCFLPCFCLLSLLTSCFYHI